MDEEYKKLLIDITKQNIKMNQKRSIKKYLIDNLLGILALIVAIIALFK